MNSCLMLGLTMYTGIDFTAAFKDEDLGAEGIERDPHITIFYDSTKKVPDTDMAEVIRTIMGDNEYEDFLARLKKQDPIPVLDHFGLGKFENPGADYLVLKLQPESDLYPLLQNLNTGLTRYYKIKSDFPDYDPHLTLATLQPGKAAGYMFSGILNLILEKATFTLDDFILSTGWGESDYCRTQITSENAIGRYFRLKHLQEDKEWYDSL